ncbi:ras GEF [Xylariomycetidae sp. FL0641]|nr:ras GEF [Xylariomycetidae sp. FL0641]
MDIDPLGLHPPTNTHSNPILRRRPLPELSTNAQKPSASARGRDARAEHSAQSPRFADKFPQSKVWVSPVTSAKPLLPAGERRFDVQNGVKGKKTFTGEKGSITPDGSSAGREGRHFTVANVGNNGQIFLRPTVRPANQRYPQPPFVFPATPPSTAGFDALPHKIQKGDETSELYSGQLTPTFLTDSPSPGMVRKKAYFEYNASTIGRRRAMSDSTIQDASIAQEGEAGAFKVMISKPPDEPKSRTTEDIDVDGGPLMQISIPSWKLGTPRFTSRGTPIIRGSSYAPTEDIRSSNASFFRSSQRDRNSLLPGTLDTRKPSSISPQAQMPSPGLLSPMSPMSPASPSSPSSPGSPRFPPLHSSYMSARLVIEPAMFDALTFKPTCDDRSIVRYSALTHAVTAATPARLVAEITSPSFLDYELISDFFLTFRSFMDTSDLLKMLIARLRWALARNDETGMIVKVRTFVAIRHWILNYFVDDFVVDYQLRVTFCGLLNDFVDELVSDPRERKVPLKILGELKKCWRRVCAQYWDGPEFEACLNLEDPVVPGGIAGHRDPGLDPSFWETDSEEPPQLYSIQLPDPDTQARDTFYADVSRAGYIDTILLDGIRPATPQARPSQLERHQTSPISIASLDVASCSFPTKALRKGEQKGIAPLGAHPVDPSSIYTDADPIAPTPRALTGKRVRAQTAHKRNDSLTDSIRGRGTLTEKVLYKNAEFLLTLPYAGSLVRGNLLPPGQAFVNVEPRASASANRQTTLFQVADTGKGKSTASAMSGQGMKKLIGGVRRALSVKGPGFLHTQDNFINIAPIGPRGATTNRLPGTAIVPQARQQRPNGGRQGVRIDILGAQVAEDFKKAVREDAADNKPAGSESTSSKSPIAAGNVDYSAAHLDSSFELRPRSEAAISTGSKSIVIVDDTVPGDYHVMTGALTALNPSVEAFAESMDPSGVANPTPPTTPPSQAARGNTPRRSSYLLGQHFTPPSLSEHPLPSPAADTRMVESRPQSQDRNELSRSSLDSVLSLNRPPLSFLRHHKRQVSSRSCRSKGRRWASFQSGIAAQSTIRSFDATTYSEASVKSEVVPPPLRVLRRRPGGDLKGAANVHDLDAQTLYRSRSAGSLTTYSESVRSSYLRSPARDSSGFINVVSSNYSQNRGEVFSLGAMAEQTNKRQTSLFSTHSSRPVMRPSFEVAAQELARIPDDTEDDGGVESALLKLEGKFEKKVSKLSIEPLKIPGRDLRRLRSTSRLDGEQSPVEKKKHRHQHVGEDVPAISPIEEDVQAGGPEQLQVPRHSEVSSFFSDGSFETYNSTPLLDRGLTDEGPSKTDTREWTNRSILEGPDTPMDENDNALTHSSWHPSYEFINKTGSMDRIHSAAKSNEDHSFLDVGSCDGSDLSSELSAEVIDEEDFLPMQSTPRSRPVHNRSTDSTSAARDEYCASSAHSVGSVKITLEQALQMSPGSMHVPELHDHQVWSHKPLPPTPMMTPTNAMYHQALESIPGHTGPQEALRGAPKLLGEPDQDPSIHLPFILAFDSEVLAQQFTLIEKDALNEVDWKELIEMRWKHSTNNSRSWVDFLRNTDARGVEVVIARFNIMVKWVISEIVLTKDLTERARCIIKYLHIAAHCREYRNYATLSQITVALTSNEIARLNKTWAMVTPEDMKLMGDLENLVSPSKNFVNLRAEMEAGGGTIESGCIPFVGIYTHDLLFNSQRPSEIASSPTTAPLVNFERCRIAASVVKTLLRLLEASTYYQFQPIEGITERCLWMGALNDDAIRQHSESLE